MATPKTITDASSDLDEANLNLFLRAGKLQVKANYFRLLFTASTNAVTVVAGFDSDGEIVSGDLAWNAGSTRVDITLTGFTATPLVIANIGTDASTNVGGVRTGGTASTNAVLVFDDGAGSAVDPDGDVECNVLIIGV